MNYLIPLKMGKGSEQGTIVCFVGGAINRSQSQIENFCVSKARLGLLVWRKFGKELILFVLTFFGERRLKRQKRVT